MPEAAKVSQRDPSRLPNPLLDLTIAALESQLKAWQAYQVEGAAFIAKRLRANLELLRAFGHCAEVGHVGECRHAWLRELHCDYAEEWGRLLATSYSLCFADLAGMGLLFGPRAPKFLPNFKPNLTPEPHQNTDAKLHAVA
jgi:hypothetical protein